MTPLSNWHLMKHDDGSVFGPVTFEQIKEWARAAQISPLDKVSSDELNWIKAPMFADLEMDWLLQMSDDHYYGPTTLSAIEEFIKEGEIDNETLVINCKDATQTRVGELPFLIDSKGTPAEQAIERLVKRLEMVDAELILQRKRIGELEVALEDFLTPH